MSAIRVRDRNGTVVIRADGKLLDGDRVDMARDRVSVRVPLMLMDSAAAPTSATLDAGRCILGEAFAEAEYAGLTDTAARHAVVRKRLGDAANGRPAPFLDAAWTTLAAPHGAPAPKSDFFVMTDSQKAVAAEGVRRALADHAGQTAPGRAGADGARAARAFLDGERWKGGERQSAERLLDGASYPERMAIKSGAYPSHVKQEDRKLSDDEFFRRQREYGWGAA